MSRYNRAPLLTRMVDRPSQDTVPIDVAREAEKRAKERQGRERTSPQADPLDLLSDGERVGLPGQHSARRQ